MFALLWDSLFLLAGAPLASMVKVIQTRCSGPLVWQLSLMSILNGSLWVAYGLVTPCPLALTMPVLNPDLAISQLHLLLRSEH